MDVIANSRPRVGEEIRKTVTTSQLPITPPYRKEHGFFSHYPAGIFSGVGYITEVAR